MFLDFSGVYSVFFLYCDGIYGRFIIVGFFEFNDICDDFCNGLIDFDFICFICW